MDDEDYKMLNEGLTSITNNLADISADLRFFVEREKRREQAEVATRKEAWDYVQKQRLVVLLTAQECPFCKEESRLILRGSKIIACVKCMTQAMTGL